MKEVIFPRGHAIEEAQTITATVIAARAAIDERGDVTLIYRGDGHTFTLRHALDKYSAYTVSQRIRELKARLDELDEEKSSVLREIETEREYGSKAEILAAPTT